MGMFLGIDVGTVSLKLAIVGDEGSRDSLHRAATDHGLFYRPSDEELTNPDLASRILVTHYARIKGNPVQSTWELLRRVLETVPAGEVEGLRVCGSGGGLIGELLQVNYENDFRAIARGVGELYPHIRTVLEMGGQNSKFILYRDGVI